MLHLIAIFYVHSFSIILLIYLADMQNLRSSSRRRCPTLRSRSTRQQRSNASSPCQIWHRCGTRLAGKSSPELAIGSGSERRPMDLYIDSLSKTPIWTTPKNTAARSETRKHLENWQSKVRTNTFLSLCTLTEINLCSRLIQLFSVSTRMTFTRNTTNTTATTTNNN